MRSDRRFVLIHLTAHQHGGLETHTYYLSHLLVSHGFAVTLVSQRLFDLNHAWTRSLLDAGVEIVRPPMLASRLPGSAGLLLARGSIAFRLRGRSFDFVVGEGHGGAYRWARRFVSPSGRFLWQEYWDGLPTKGDTYHGYGTVASEHLPPRMVRMIESLDGIIAGCERARTNLRTVQGVRKPIRIVPPLTRLDTPDVRERAYAADTQLNVVMVGRLGRGKGVEVLVADIWPRLSVGPALLHLHGEFEDPGLKAHVSSVAAGHPSIRLHGGFERGHLASILAHADLGLMLSIEEGYGLVACEYMAAGLPFVMTDVGAAAEFTHDNPDALQVAVDPAAIRDGINAMVARIRGGQTSRRRLAHHYRTTFSFDQIAAGHLYSFEQPEEFWAETSDPDV